MLYLFIEQDVILTISDRNNVEASKKYTLTTEKDLYHEVGEESTSNEIGREGKDIFGIRKNDF